MKKNILFLFILSLIFSCAVKKPEQRSKLLKGFSAKYNTLFNSEEALKAEFAARTESHKDNFYAPFINILTYEDIPQSNIAPNAVDNSAPPMPGSASRGSAFSGATPVKGASILEISEAKALKAIDKYSVTREGQEQNDIIFDAYLTLAQARIYMGKPLSALDAINQIYTKMKDDKRMPTAKIYEALAYAKMKDYFKANELFAALKTQKLKKEDENLLAIFYSESLLASGNKTQAILELDRGFEIQKDRKLKSRMAFLRGQILASTNNNEKARESFMASYQYANDFEFEVKSQIEIAKTYNGKNDYSGAKEYLENISKKGTYASRRNEFYYALGVMADKAGKKEEAMDFFHRSLKENVSDPQIRGLDYFEIGKSFLANNEYISAGAYYDSALTVMTYEPTKIELREQSDYIKKIAKNYYLVKKNDSILALTKMSEPERETYFASYITALKTKEENAQRALLQENRNKGFGDSDTNANSIFASNSKGLQDFGAETKGFYFANNSTVAKGTSEFKKVWGERALSDNWRLSPKGNSIADEKNIALGLTTAPDPRRYETSFYTEKIPRDANTLDALKKARDTASFGLGMMYENYFSNTPLATKTLYSLVDNKPEEKLLLQTLYEVFNMNYKNAPAIAERAKQILITDYPYTSFAEFARNPQNTSFVKSNPAVEDAYQRAYGLFSQENFMESLAVINQTMKQYPKDALMPKFALLNAFNTGKTAGKEVMILQLEQIALNYDKTSEGQKAKEMLQYLKSELQIEGKDNQGNKVNSNFLPQKPTDNDALDNGEQRVPTKQQQAEMLEQSPVNTNMNMQPKQKPPQNPSGKK